MWVDYLLQHYHSPRILPILLEWSNTLCVIKIAIMDPRSWFMGPSWSTYREVSLAVLLSTLCDLWLNDEESFYYHLSDIHSLRRRGRRNGHNRKTGNQKRKRLEGDIHNGKQKPTHMKGMPQTDFIRSSPPETCTPNSSIVMSSPALSNLGIPRAEPSPTFKHSHYRALMVKLSAGTHTHEYE